MKAVLLLDAGDTVATWQYEALDDAIANGLEVCQVAHSLDGRPRQTEPKHLGYRLLATASTARIGALKPKSLRPLLEPGVQEVSFSPDSDGAVERIPPSVADGFRGADVVVKLGTSALGDPDSLPVPYGVLAYRHGEAGRRSDGLPGFDEVECGAEVERVVVERLNGAGGRGEAMPRS